MLDVHDIDVAFDGRQVLDGVSFTVHTGEVVALLGPSGSGKTTLLRVIAGLHHPDAGRIVIDGRDVTDVPVHRRSVGLVFQDEQLFPHLDVAGNVAFGLRMAHRPRAEQAARVRELLHLVGLAGFEHRRVTSLSGGEAKRVALARSLAPTPAVLLLDEPLTGLDPDLHDRLVTDLALLLRRTGTTAVMVTHLVAEAQAIADRIITVPSVSRPSVPRPSVSRPSSQPNASTAEP